MGSWDDPKIRFDKLSKILHLLYLTSITSVWLHKPGQTYTKDYNTYIW